MSTPIKIKRRPSHHSVKIFSQKLPKNVAKQLEDIYFQSIKSIKRRPYTIVSRLILSLGIGSSIYLLMRYFKNK